jgi:tRNA pseudouridine38-40 synthase
VSSARLDSPPAAERHRLWAKVEYDGTSFYGFQIQAREPTVQGEIERAIRSVVGVETRVVGAGRTDRGVHARGQVISFEVEWQHELSSLQRALNATLDAGVAVVEMGPAPAGFHPRFSAVSRTYRYTLLNRAQRSPLARLTAWHVVQGLDVERMVQASQHLLGSHDFSTFGRPTQGESTVRTVMRAEFREEEPFVLFDIEANAFLYRMVRSITGTLVQVGRGSVSPEQLRAMLGAQDRSQIRLVAPAHGLCLMRVDYGNREGVVQ